MPGRSENKDGFCWLPIDAKFPMEDYQRLVAAQDLVDVLLIEETGKALENRIKLEAKSIYDKYIDPPNTTDVALLFLPVEGLFAEILRRPGLFEKLQNDYKVIITGPTTLTAILNSLQMGFKTLAIEKRSSEVWTLLGAVKNEFSKFGDILEKTQEKLRQASDTIDSAKVRSRAIERRLRDVQELPTSEPNNLIE
jgi:DNA recombination protein RmuC